MKDVRELGVEPTEMRAGIKDLKMFLRETLVLEKVGNKIKLDLKYKDPTKIKDPQEKYQELMDCLSYYKTRWFYEMYLKEYGSWLERKLRTVLENGQEGHKYRINEVESLKKN